VMHQVVTAQLAAARAGTHSTKTRAEVAGGGAKPWRQKGTGRARAGTSRAPHWTGGGVAFPPTMRSFKVKVNRKVSRAALRAALAVHARDGSLALVDGSSFPEPSTKQAAAFVETWGQPRPLVLVVGDDEDGIAKSFRNLERVVVVAPSDLEVAAVVWARSLLVSQAALATLQARAGGSSNAEPAEQEEVGG